MTLHNQQQQKVHPIEITVNEETENPTTSNNHEISSKAIDKVNRKAFVIDNFDKSMELKNVDESLDDFSWVPKSPLTSATQYRPKSARNRYDQAFRIDNDQFSPSNQQAYYKQAAFNHILNNSNVHNNETTQKNDDKCIAQTKPKPKSAPPHIKRNSTDNRKNPFAAIKGLLNMCKHKNHHVEDVVETKVESSSKNKQDNCQNIIVEKTQVVVFDNRANREELPPSPQMNRRAKCGGYGNDDSNRDQPIIVPLYYHVVNANSTSQNENANSQDNTPNAKMGFHDLSDSISDIQEI